MIKTGERNIDLDETTDKNTIAERNRRVAMEFK